MVEKIILVEPRSFCPGVQRILNIIDLVAKRYPDRPKLLNHEAVHNKHVTDSLKNMGIAIEEDPEKLPAGAVFILSAHGSSPEFQRRARARDITVIDGTCPLVAKVHLEANRYADLGYTILYIGHKGHPEAEVAVGIRPEKTVFIHNVDDAKNINVSSSGKLICLSQTTLSIDDCKAITDALKGRFPNIEFPPAGDICLATTNRQAAVKKLAEQADLVFVVGSKNSSNSNRLAEAASKKGIAAYLIDDASEIRREWLDGKNRIGITAGASAPEYLVQGVVQFLKDGNGGKPLEVETLKVVEENARFALPKELSA
jgi:4-hydroxy-3-methylbut-2-enyl diphosphate reductase